MSDTVNSNTPEFVAYRLMQDISGSEDLADHSENVRKDFLDLYAECLEAVKGQRQIK